jgi:cation transport ATPase
MKREQEQKPQRKQALKALNKVNMKRLIFYLFMVLETMLGVATSFFIPSASIGGVIFMRVIFLAALIFFAYLAYKEIEQKHEPLPRGR